MYPKASLATVDHGLSIRSCQTPLHRTQTFMFGAYAIIRPKTVVQSHNLDDLEKVARFARQHGVEVFYQPIEPSLLPSSLPLPQPRSPQPLTELAHNPRSSSARLLLQSASAISIRLKRRVWLKRKKSLRRSNLTSLPPAGQRTRGAAPNSNLGSVAEGRNLLRGCASSWPCSHSSRTRFFLVSPGARLAGHCTSRKSLPQNASTCSHDTLLNALRRPRVAPRCTNRPRFHIYRESTNRS